MASAAVLVLLGYQTLQARRFSSKQAAQILTVNTEYGILFLIFHHSDSKPTNGAEDTDVNVHWFGNFVWRTCSEQMIALHAACVL